MTEPSPPSAPPPLGRRERHKLDTRRALEDAALALFARDGFERTTVEAIAERAQVSPRTFFRYFAAKEEVLDMGWTTRREQLLALTATAEREAHDLDVAVAALAAMAVDLEAELDRVRMRAAAVATSAALRGRTADSMAAWEAALALGLAGRRGLEHPDDQAAVAAAVAMGLWRWATRRWVDQRSGVPLAELVRGAAARLP